MCVALPAEKPKAAPEPLPIEDGVAKLDIRVGKVISAEKHPEADKYVSSLPR